MVDVYAVHADVRISRVSALDEAAKEAGYCVELARGSTLVGVSGEAWDHPAPALCGIHALTVSMLNHPHNRRSDERAEQVSGRGTPVPSLRAGLKPD